MIRDHERLDVYRLALDFLVFAHQVIQALPRGRSHLCDQLTRASTSIVLNLAEGAGKHSKADKRRYYLSARGSATESAALLDVLSRLGLLDESGHHAGKEMLIRVVSMLIKLSGHGFLWRGSPANSSEPREHRAGHRSRTPCPPADDGTRPWRTALWLVGYRVAGPL
jgi:four helix bundle protein